jgi:hypothetical protein
MMRMSIGLVFLGFFLARVNRWLCGGYGRGGITGSLGASLFLVL